MTAPSKLLLALCFASFASAISLRAVDPMLPEIAETFAVPLREAALLVSAYAFPYALMQLVFGPAGDALGRSRLIRLSVAMVAVGSAAAALAPHFAVALLARAVAGSFAGGIIPVCLALVGDRTSLDQRQHALSRVMLASIIGQMTGAAGSGLITAVSGWRSVFALTAAVGALAWLATLFALDGRGEQRSRFTPGQALAGYRLVLANPASVFSFVMVGSEGFFLFGAFPFVAPLLAAHDHTGSFAAGLTLAAFAIGGVGYGLTVRPLLATLGQRGMMRIGAVLAGLAYMGAAAPLPWLCTALMFFCGGFGFYMLHNTLQAQATELAPRARGATFALFASSFFLGQGLGPVAGGLVVQIGGLASLFLGAGLALIIVIFLATRTLPR